VESIDLVFKFYVMQKEKLQITYLLDTADFIWPYMSCMPLCTPYRVKEKKLFGSYKHLIEHAH